MTAARRNSARARAAAPIWSKSSAGRNRCRPCAPSSRRKSPGFRKVSLRRPSMALESQFDCAPVVRCEVIAFDPELVDAVVAERPEHHVVGGQLQQQAVSLFLDLGIALNVGGHAEHLMAWTDR